MMTVISVKVSVVCPFCGKENFLTLSADDFNAWQNGMSVQDAFPYLSADEREGLITGICPECWDKMFPSDDPEEDWEDEWPEFPSDNPESYWEDEEDGEDSEWEEREDFPDDHLWDSYDLEVGFNPYMGCYDYDC